MCLFLHRAGRRMRAHGPMSKRTRPRRRSKYVATQVARSKARQRAKADEYYLTFAKKKEQVPGVRSQHQATTGAGVPPQPAACPAQALRRQARCRLPPVI